MWKFLKSIVKPNPVATGSTDSPKLPSESWVLRGGKSVRADEVFAASTSQDLPRMLSALNLKTNQIDRHFLLMAIVSESYKRRADPQMAEICTRVAEMHIEEFRQIAAPLKKEMGGVLPRVSTFQNYATLLTEKAKFDRAIEVCEAAIRFGVDDGTKAGFEGRIERIRKKRQGRSRGN